MELIKFKVQTTFRLNTRNLYVVGGTVIQGVIKEPICLLWGSEKKKIQVHSKELIKENDSEFIGLLFSRKDMEDLLLLENIKNGEILEFINCEDLDYI